MLGPFQWSMPKIMKSDAKLSEIYEQNEWHLFSGQCNLQFLSPKVLQGSVPTRVNYGKNFENWLASRRVTGKNKVAPFFQTRCTI